MPSDMSLIPVLGNRDVSATKRFPEDKRAADMPKLILSDPAAHVRRMLGIDLNGGVRTVSVRDVNVVAADWGHEGELEKFMSARSELCDPSRPLVHIQHPHPKGVFDHASSNDAATCWLKMFPKAVSISGHSHIPFSHPHSFHAGEFTFVAAGSHYLSGGEQQRTAIARALALDPDFIIADEPTGNLDSKNAEIIISLFRKLVKEGKTVIMVTHSEELAGYTDRIIRMKDGKIQENE